MTNVFLNKGNIISINGHFMDIFFPERIPEINQVLQSGPEDSIQIRVIQHLSNNMVRGKALTPTTGLLPGSTVICQNPQ